MIQLYINNSNGSPGSRSLQKGDHIEFHSMVHGGHTQTYEVMKIHNKPIGDAIGRIKLIWSCSHSDKSSLNQTFDLHDRHLPYFKYGHDSRTPFGKFINDIYVKEKDK